MFELGEGAFITLKYVVSVLPVLRKNHPRGEFGFDVHMLGGTDHTVFFATKEIAETNRRRLVNAVREAWMEDE